MLWVIFFINLYSFYIYIFFYFYFIFFKLAFINVFPYPNLKNKGFTHFTLGKYFEKKNIAMIKIK